MWDGRASSLEEQALGPIRADVEMNLPIDQLIEKLKSISGYIPLFRAAFPKEALAPGSIAKAIATYERTVVSGALPTTRGSKAMRKRSRNRQSADLRCSTPKAGCSNCHSGWNFTDDSFHDTAFRTTISAAANSSERGQNGARIQDAGLREITAEALTCMMDLYRVWKRSWIITTRWDQPLSRSDQIKPLGLSKQEMGELVVFMKTMTSDMAPTAVPILPR